MMLIDSDWSKLGEINFETLKITIKPKTFSIKIDKFHDSHSEVASRAFESQRLVIDR